MAEYDPNSRYLRHARTHLTTDRRGRVVRAFEIPRLPPQTLLGEHRRRGSERLDHLAFHYLDDPYGFWRLCQRNDVIVPDALAEAAQIKIPTRL